MNGAIGRSNGLFNFLLVIEEKYVNIYFFLLNHCKNVLLKQEVLSLLENGETLGATGLSNPMKYYAGLETLHLKAEETETGYVINGTLPAVSNLDEKHWFGVIAINQRSQTNYGSRSLFSGRINFTRKARVFSVKWNSNICLCI